jgi:hypothetical protein
MQEAPIPDLDGTWFKSSYSGAGNTECVEAAFLLGGTAVRDSKTPVGPILHFPGGAWGAFVRAVRRGGLPADV